MFLEGYEKLKIQSLAVFDVKILISIRNNMLEGRFSTRVKIS